MKKEYIILIAAGVFLTTLIITAKKSAVDVIKPGDKGNEVYGLQSAFFNMTGVKIENGGAYDKTTLSAVQCLLRGSSALRDYDRGYVDRTFANDLFLIQKNAKLK
jgi:hypothetical protein